MTYCVAIALRDGIVFTSDSRTNAGVDQVSTYSKMHTFGLDGDRQFVLLTSGNLATTQAVVAQLQRDIRDAVPTNLFTARHISEAADYLGQLSRVQQDKHGGGATYQASFLLGGQINHSQVSVMLVYPAGNHITTSEDTPFLQIGESKYGKPILDRIVTPDTSLETAAVASLVSMDSTMRSNVTVGPPIELLIYRKDSLKLGHRYRLDDDSPYLRELRKNWDDRLKEAFRQLPRIEWATAHNGSPDAQNAISR